MTIYEIVKQNVNNREAAELYGIDISRTSMANCPFHPDKHPSLYVADDHFHCFGCHAHGDVIDFTARLFGISGKSAARKLARDFGLSPDPSPGNVLQLPKTPQMEQRDQEWRCMEALQERIQTLSCWHKVYAPQEPGEEFHPRFLQACRELPQLKHWLDGLQFGNAFERQAVVEEIMADGSLFRREAA